MNQEGEGRESWTEPLTSRALSVSRLRRPSKVAACNPLSLISPPACLRYQPVSCWRSYARTGLVDCIAISEE